MEWKGDIGSQISNVLNCFKIFFIFESPVKW